MTIKLSEEQERIIQAPSAQHMRILACCGSGKTTTILYRVRELQRRGISDILILTFNVDAKNTLKSKAKRIINSGVGIYTIDGFARMLHNGHEPAPDLYAFRIAQNIQGAKIRPPQTQDDQGVLQNIQKVLLPQAQDDQGVLQNTQKVLFPQTQYDQEIQKYRYVFFDEFQDIDRFQFIIFQRFYELGSIMTVIGDDAQNVYEFRDSVVDYILKFNDYIPDAVTYTLTTNYRSTPEIIEYATAFIRNSQCIQKEMHPVRKSIGKFPRVRGFPYREAECTAVAHDIRYLVSQKLCRPNRIAVIGRQRKNQLFKMEAAILRGNTSSSCINVYPLYDDKIDIGRLDIPENAVILTTFHACKGLEWDVVFVIGIDQRNIPRYSSQIELEAERRLFYVGITRAKSLLNITFSGEGSAFLDLPRNLFLGKLTVKPLKNNHIQTEKVGVVDILKNLRREEKDRLLKLCPDLDFETKESVHPPSRISDYVEKLVLHGDFGEFIDRWITKELFPDPVDRDASLISKGVTPRETISAIYWRFRSVIDDVVGNSQEVPELPQEPVDFISQIWIDRTISYVKEHGRVDIPHKYTFAFLSEWLASDMEYHNPNADPMNIMKEIYNISLARNIVSGRSRMLYLPEAFNIFCSDVALFENIRKHVDAYRGNIVCKPAFSYKFILGELDLLILDEKKIVDYKTSTLSKNMATWILQLLAYTGLSRINGYEVNIIEIYNPIAGFVAKHDVANWNHEEFMNTLLELRC